jgi:hypothetical protein
MGMRGNGSGLGKHSLLEKDAEPLKEVLGHRSLVASRLTRKVSSNCAEMCHYLWMPTSQSLYEQGDKGNAYSAAGLKGSLWATQFLVVGVQVCHRYLSRGETRVCFH